MKIEYNIDGNLVDVLVVAMEIKSEIGISPETIKLNNGQNLKFNNDSCKALITGKIDEKEYIKKHID